MCGPTQPSQPRLIRSKSVREVVVVGNGPSAISLSYLLSGHVPFYSGISEDAGIDARIDRDKPIVLQDLEHLAMGCEGRSSNPVSVLFDALSHPDADLGAQHPSLLTWRHDPSLELDHLVLGRGVPGGCWKDMEGHVQTVSFGTWMQLANLDFKLDHNKDARVPVARVASYYREYVKRMGLEKFFRNDVRVISVKRVRLQHDNEKDDDKICLDDEECLDDNECFVDTECHGDQVCKGDSEEVDFFLANQSAIFCAEEEKGRGVNRLCSDNKESSDSGLSCRTSSVCSSSSTSFDVTKTDDEEEEIFEDCYDTLDSCLSWDPIVNPTLFGSLASIWGDSNLSHSKSRRSNSISNNTSNVFEVIYECEHTGQQHRLLSRNVVLATGSVDVPNLLGLPNEHSLSFVMHSLSRLEQLISSESVDRSVPVLVVGAGLSAADAIIMALDNGLSVVHAFRKEADDPSMIFKRLPSKLYPEYHNVYRMMSGKQTHPLYTPLAEHEVIGVERGGIVELKVGRFNVRLSVSCMLVLIGSAPDLSFVDTKSLGVPGLGLKPHLPVGRGNPVGIDVFSNEVNHVDGLFAMGPLVGDNFVRFLQGGAIAIAAKLMQRANNNNDKTVHLANKAASKFSQDSYYSTV